ncbi:MAG: preprotein translocase subunit SecY [Bacteriovoracales bacterium]|nr:preprotein translocase subunit SecY [Bacteriovoracales bacterium]
MNIGQGKLEELKKKILATLLLLIVFRIAAQIPVPGVDGAALKSYFDAQARSIFDLINTFNGGALKRLSVLALGIMPYITTSIIFSLLGEVIPQIQELQEDSDGHKKIQKWTRYATVFLCMVQGYGMATFFESVQSQSGLPVIPEPGVFFRLTTMITLTAGTIFLMWLGERITEYGLENGISLIIFAGIAVDMPAEFIGKITLFQNGELSGFALLGTVLVVIMAFFVISFIEKSYRNVSVQYAKKVVHNRVYGGAQSLPMKVDTGGVMPPILASSLLMAPATVFNLVPKESFIAPYLETVTSSLYPGQLLFNVVFGLLIMYMAYFYAPIQFKTKRVSQQMQKNNAFIPGIRPGEKTKEFLDFVLNRLTFFGALFLIIICIVPSIVNPQTRLGGTALLIVVSVSIRMIMNIQAFLFSGRYETAYKSRGKYSGTNKRF